MHSTTITLPGLFCAFKRCQNARNKRVVLAHHYDRVVLRNFEFSVSLMTSAL